MSNQGNEEKFLEFHEFHMEEMENDFRDSGAAGLTSLDMDDHVFGEFDLEAKYRSISAVQNTHSFGFNLATHNVPPTGVGKDTTTLLSHPSPGATVIARQDAPKATSAAPKIEVTPKISNDSKSNGPITVPIVPFYVAPSTHFVTKLNVGDIKARVEVELNNQTGVSYEFFGSKCRWEGVYLVGSVRCKFEINVYKQVASDGFVVEGNRLSGDSLAFVNIYQSIRNIFVPPTSDCVLSDPFLPIPSGVDDASSVEVKESIDSVLAMASSGIAEAQLGASQILCDLFCRDDVTHLINKHTECLTALMTLTSVEFESCNQHAICALAHLSSSHSCQEVLMHDENFLKTLLPLCSDGNFNSIEMRRECARLLANISCSGGEAGAQQVVSCAGLENIESWMQSVDGLKDERLRVHADRAKLSLASCT